MRNFESWLCVLLLIVIPAIALFPVLFQEQLPLSLQGIFFQPPWEEARPAELHTDADPFTALHHQRYYPDYQFLSAAASGEHSLLWNPQEALGMPFFALWRTRVLSPFSIPFYLLPFMAALSCSVFLKLLIAGWTAFYAARRFGFTAAFALFIAVTFQLSSPLYLSLVHPVADVLPWFPLLLITAELLMLGQLRAWPFMGIVIGLMALGGSPEMLIAILLWLLIYMVLRRVTDPAHVSFRLAAISAIFAVVLGLGLAAVQVVPYIEFLRHSTPSVAEELPRLTWGNVFGLVLPTAASATEPAAPWLARLFFVGLPGVFLVALWCSLRRFVEDGMRRRVEALLASALILVALPLITGAGQHALPLLDLFSPMHYFVAFALAFGLMAATAAEEWTELDPEQTKAALARLLPLLPITWLLAFVALLFAAYRSATPEQRVWPQILLAIVIAAGVFALLVATLLNPRARVLGYGLAGLTFLSLLGAFRPALPLTSPENAFPETSFIASLRSMNTRIGGSESLQGWPLSVHGIHQVFSVHRRTLDRYAKFVEEVNEHPLLLRRTAAQALLLTREDIQGPFASVRPVLNIQEAYPTGAILLRDLEALPRARVIYEGQPVEHFDPEALDPQAPPLLEGTTLPETDKGARARVHITDATDDREIRIRVERTRPGLLVLADSWYPGWKATVDGVSTTIYPVDGIFRGVELGEGEHEVVFYYDPLSIKIGLAISLGAFLVLLWQWRDGLRRRLQRSR